jgi:hypothetical protein
MYLAERKRVLLNQEKLCNSEQACSVLYDFGVLQLLAKNFPRRDRENFTILHVILFIYRFKLRRLHLNN